MVVKVKSKTQALDQIMKYTKHTYCRFFKEKKLVINTYVYDKNDSSFSKELLPMTIYQREIERKREITYSYFLVMKTNEPSVFICAAFHIYIKGRSKTIPRYVFTASRNILIFQINIRITL